VLPEPTGYWGNYLRGVAHFLQLQGRSLQGCDVLIEGNLPIGAGLSSSAALEVGFAYLLQTLCCFELEPVALAQLCQRAENQFARTNCGIMDQVICRLGQRDCALFLDCRTLQTEQIQLPTEGWVALLADTHVKHQLVGSAYNERRQQTAEAASILAQRIPGVLSLRDVGPEDLDLYGARLPSVLYQRARHVVDENERVHKAVAALRDGDLKHFGAILNETHASLRDNFEVSCPELDCLAAVAQELAGVYGARMVGGGFGGCVLIICRRETVGETQEELSAIFSRHFGRVPAFYQTGAESGVHQISPD
jgi:galactokinase